MHLEWWQPFYNIRCPCFKCRASNIPFFSVPRKQSLSPLFKGVCLAQRSARQVLFLLSCLVNIEHLTVQSWPSLHWGGFNNGRPRNVGPRNKRGCILHLPGLMTCIDQINKSSFTFVSVFIYKEQHIDFPKQRYLWRVVSSRCYQRATLTPYYDWSFQNKVQPYSGKVDHDQLLQDNPG